MAKGYARKAFVELLQQKQERMTVKEIAKRCQVPSGNIRKWISGVQSPSKQRMKVICNRLGIDQGLLEVDDARYHQIWKLEHFTCNVLQRRYADLLAARQTFEAVLTVNMVAVLLLRELSHRGFPMTLHTDDSGSAELLPRYPGSVMEGLMWRVVGNLDSGIQMAVCPRADTSHFGDWVLALEENVCLLVDSCVNLRG